MRLYAFAELHIDSTQLDQLQAALHCFWCAVHALLL